jgi:hypothetical protein
MKVIPKALISGLRSSHLFCVFSRLFVKAATPVWHCSHGFKFKMPESVFFLG